MHFSFNQDEILTERHLFIIKMSNKNFKYKNNNSKICLGPYHVESTGSRPITEVKQRRAQLVLGWVTAWEYWVF